MAQRFSIKELLLGQVIHYLLILARNDIAFTFHATEVFGNNGVSSGLFDCSNCIE